MTGRMPVTRPAPRGEGGGMAFTQITVTCAYGAGASGTVTFTPSQTMINDEDVVPCSPIVATLDDNGDLSVVLAANDDIGTQPPGTCWCVTETLDGTVPRDYFISVPSGASGATGNLADLMPTTIAWA